MIYTPPDGAAVDFALIQGYQTPAYDALRWRFGVSAGLGTAGFVDRWQDAGRKEAAVSGGWIDTPANYIEAKDRWQDAAAKGATTGSAWSKIPPQTIAAAAPWGDMTQRADSATTGAYVAVMPTRDYSRVAPWGLFVAYLDDERRAPYRAPPPRDASHAESYFHVDLVGDQYPVWVVPPPPPGSDPTLDFHFAGAYAPPPWSATDYALAGGYLAPGSVYYDPGFDPSTLRAIQPRASRAAVAFNAPPTVEPSWKVAWGAGSWDRPPPASYIKWVAEPPELPERPIPPVIFEVYFFMPSISITTVPAGQVIEASAATLSIDKDTWAWRIKATIADQASLDLVRPDSNGPKEILININGHEWAGLVESYSRSRLFGRSGWTISARGPSAALSAPYSTRISQAVSADYSASALAGQAVATLGWTINWLAPDWVVKGGAWSFQDLDPIGRLVKLAESVGAKLRPHATQKVIDVVPSYPVSPHLWSGAALDAILPDSLILDLGGAWRPGQLYNRSIVAGSQVGGVLVSATRQGTAGDIMAPQVVDPLITAVAAGQERARIEMDKGGNRENVSIKTMLGSKGGAGPELYLPFNLLEVQETGGETWRGMVGSVSISANSSDSETTVRQSIELERYHG